MIFLRLTDFFSEKETLLNVESIIQIESGINGKGSIITSNTLGKMPITFQVYVKEETNVVINNIAKNENVIIC